MSTRATPEVQYGHERRFTKKIRCGHDKQVHGIATDTAGVYGEIRGVIGATAP